MIDLGYCRHDMLVMLATASALPRSIAPYEVSQSSNPCRSKLLKFEWTWLLWQKAREWWLV